MLTLNDFLSDYFEEEIKKPNIKYEYSCLFNFLEKLEDNETINTTDKQYILESISEIIFYVIKVVATCPNLKLVLNADLNIDLKYKIPLLLGGGNNEL